MSKTKIDLVPHPRYGTTTAPSGIVISEKAIRDGFWGLQDDAIAPDSVLIADSSKQNFSTFPRKYYVDVLRHCRDCGRPFIFFAREQRYWFETLRFFVDADCVHCPACRRQSRNIRRRIRRYSNLAGKKAIDNQEMKILVSDAEFLLRHGVLRNLTRLGQIKNRAKKQIPAHAGTELLAQALANARKFASR